MTCMAEYADLFNEADVRIDKMFWLAAIGDHLPDELIEMLLEEMEPDDVCAMLGLKLDENGRAEVFEHGEPWMLADLIADMQFTHGRLGGFILFGSSPVRQYFNSDDSEEHGVSSSYSSSWGHYYRLHAYGESLDEAVGNLLRQTKERHARQLARFKEKQASKLEAVAKAARAVEALPQAAAAEAAS